MRPVEHLRGVDEPVVDLPQALGVRHHHVVKHDVGGVRGPQPHLFHQPPRTQALAALFHDEGGQPLLLARRRGRGEHDVDLGHRALRDEALVPTEHPFAAARPFPPDRARARRPRVRTGTGLGQAPRAERSPARQTRQEALALGLGARQIDVVHAQQVVRGHGQPQRGVGARQLLDRDREVEHPHTRPAIAFGNVDPQEPKLCDGLDDLHRKMRCLVPARGVGSDGARAEFAHGPLQNLLFLAQLEVHRWFPVGVISVASGAAPRSPGQRRRLGPR